MDSSLFLPAACAAGILSHVLYFNRGEHHLLGLKYMQLFFIACATAIATLVRCAGCTFRNAFSQVAPAAASYLAGLLGACMVYRAFFNPLNKITGPLPARFSSLWYSTQGKDAQLHKRLAQLHCKYGPFVRVGSNDLSCVHPEAVQAIYGHGTRCKKGPGTAVIRLSIPCTLYERERFTIGGGAYGALPSATKHCADMRSASSLSLVA